MTVEAPAGGQATADEPRPSPLASSLRAVPTGWWLVAGVLSITTALWIAGRMTMASDPHF